MMLLIDSARKEGTAVNVPGHYETDVLFFFDGSPDRLALYQALFRRLDAAVAPAPGR